MLGFHIKRLLFLKRSIVLKSSKTSWFEKPFTDQTFGGLIPKILPRDKSQQQSSSLSHKPFLLLAFRKRTQLSDY